MEEEELRDNGVSEHTGFPNAATDARLSGLDLTKLLIRHPSSTYYLRAAGTSGQDYGVEPGDIVVVDRALEARIKDLVIWWDNDSFIISRVKLLPEGVTPWGVVTHVIHAFRGKVKV
jgi:DNA polymerase V